MVADERDRSELGKTPVPTPPSRQHQQPPNDEVCSSVSIDSSRTTALPPRGSKCSTELTGSCRIHTAHRQRLSLLDQVGGQLDLAGLAESSDIGHRCAYPFSR